MLWNESENSVRESGNEISINYHFPFTPTMNIRYIFNCSNIISDNVYSY